ncbi:MAG: extracellular solute-binding protein [Oscillospiraceae bacterium]|nr:extracellular solute-binding protein [Oscillospiraceae bacterium]
MKRIVSLLTAVLMVISLAAILPASSETVQWKGELKYLMTSTPTDPNDEPPARKLEELTGYKVTYYTLPAEGFAEKLNLDLASGVEYDIIRLGKNEFVDLASRGAFVDLAPYLPQAPSLKAIMSDDMWNTAAIDGKILGIPQFDAHYVSASIAINVQMFEEIGFTIEGHEGGRQVTLNEFVDLLRKLKANGAQYPLTGQGAFVDVIASAFGIVNHDWQPDLDGSIVYRWGHTNAKDYISFMHDLYEESLIDPEWPMNKGEITQTKLASGQAASRQVGWTESTPLEASLMDSKGQTLDYLVATVDDDGFGRLASNGGVTMYGVIPVTSKQVDKVIDYLNIRSDFAVFQESFLGVEGEQWEFLDTDGDGEMEYWPILDEARLPGFTPWFNGHYYNIVNSPESFTTLWMARVRKGPVQYACTMKTMEFPQEKWVDSSIAFAPPLEAVSKNIAAMNTLMNDYVIECIAGTRSIDEYDLVWAEFLAEGGQEMLDEVNGWVATQE